MTFVSMNNCGMQFVFIQNRGIILHRHKHTVLLGHIQQVRKCDSVMKPCSSQESAVGKDFASTLALSGSVNWG